MTCLLANIVTKDSPFDKMSRVNWRKHCALNRTHKNCSIYNYTGNRCYLCGHNKKKMVTPKEFR